MDDRMVEETLSLAKISELIKRKISFCSKEKKKKKKPGKSFFVVSLLYKNFRLLPTRKILHVVIETD